jgi:hypothetical protein
VRALIARRVQSITASLDIYGADPRPQEALAAYARGILETVRLERSIALFRLIVQNAPATPELAQAVFEASIEASQLKLAAYLAREARAGRLAITDAREAAIFYSGMVISHRQVQALFGLPVELTSERIDHIAQEAARRFLRAYAP